MQYFLRNFKDFLNLSPSLYHSLTKHVIITEKWVLKALSPIIAEAAQSRMTDDFKTLLQEKYQANGKSDIEYEVVAEEGPAHNKCFTVSVKVTGKILGTGKGRSKKAAEQAAAREALNI